MNQRARHAFVSFTLQLSAPFAVANAQDNRERKREGEGERESERSNHQEQRLRCPFWPLLEPGPRRLDISSDGYEPPAKGQIRRGYPEKNRSNPRHGQSNGARSILFT